MLLQKAILVSLQGISLTLAGCLLFLLPLFKVMQCPGCCFFVFTSTQTFLSSLAIATGGQSVSASPATTATTTSELSPLPLQGRLLKVTTTHLFQSVSVLLQHPHTLCQCSPICCSHAYLRNGGKISLLGLQIGNGSFSVTGYNLGGGFTTPEG